MTTSLDRFQLLSINQLQFPHKCSVCGGFTGVLDDGSERKFVDFQCFIEFFGTVYICTECFRGGAVVAGAMDKPNFKLEQTEYRIRELQAVVSTLIAENRTLRDGIDLLTAVVSSRPADDTDTDSVVYVSGPEERTDSPTVEPEDSSRVASGNDQTVAEGEGGSPEQTDVGGHKDVRDDDKRDTGFSGIGLDVFNI